MTEVGSDKLGSEWLQCLAPCRDSLLESADSNMLMLESRHSSLVLVAWMAVMPPNKDGSIADVEAVAANIDRAIALDQLQGPRQLNAGREQNAVDGHLGDAVVAVGCVHREVTRQGGRPPTDLDE